MQYACTVDHVVCTKSKCDENKHDEVTFQLAAVDLNSYGLKSL